MSHKSVVCNLIISSIALTHDTLSLDESPLFIAFRKNLWVTFGKGIEIRFFSNHSHQMKYISWEDDTVRLYVIDQAFQLNIYSRFVNKQINTHIFNISFKVKSLFNMFCFKRLQEKLRRRSLHSSESSSIGGADWETKEEVPITIINPDEWEITDNFQLKFVYFTLMMPNQDVIDFLNGTERDAQVSSELIFSDSKIDHLFLRNSQMKKNV